MLRRTQQTKLRMERLEQKTMLAGDVSVVVNGDGDLVITGDAEENSLALESGVNPGEFLIIDRSAAGSTINGADKSDNGDETFLFEGVTGDVLVSLNGANDTFRVLNANLPGKLVVDGGEGDDALFLGLAESSPGTQYTPVEFADDVKFVGGAGSDVMQMRDFTIGDDLVFSGGVGFDTFAMEQNIPLSTGSSVADDAYIMGDEDVDVLIVGSVAIGDDLRVSGNDGDDQVTVADATVGSSTLVSLGDGFDQLQAFGVDAGHSMSVVGTGSNSITLVDVSSSHFLTVLTTSGDDSIIMDLVETSSALVATQSGMDNVTINSSIFDYLYVLLGSGDDSLTINGVTVDRWAVFSGGSGEDTLVDPETSDINFELAYSFENEV